MKRHTLALLGPIILFLHNGIVGMAFQPTVSSAQPQSSKQDYIHDFWSKPRTGLEVESHVRICLSDPKYSYTTDDRPSIQILSTEPPLLVVHNFLSPQMCDDIIQTALQTGKMRRSTVGSQQEMSETRTSSTVWMQEHECPDPLRLMADKVSSITGLPTSHMENLQVVRYDPGQEFQMHTDHQDSFNDLECRGRLATCLIYLAEPMKGGETWFPALTSATGENGVLVAPRRGSAVLFWNTVEKPGCDNYSANMFLHADQRLLHAGLPASAGEKWVCNRWIHPVNFGAGVRGL
jgi:prolyl 4-hydroxylase